MMKSSKKLFFYLFTISIPVLFIIILELFLNLFNYGDHLKLILTTEKDGQKFYQLNPDVGQRYFIKTDQSLIPQLYPQTFEFNKSPNTFRIFLLGGSTTAGFPYELNARWNSLLHDRLSAYYPDKNFEVINVGMSAVNSFSVLDFTRELVKYDPDLFIIYMGHNEFYGAFGVGSLEKIGKYPAVIRTYLMLKNFKTFQLLRSIIKNIFGIFQKSNQETPKRTLMASIVQEKSIPLDSQDYQLAKRYFSENLREIIDTIHQHDCPILASTLVSNLRDQPPFISLFSDTLSSKSEQRWNHFYERGKKQYQMGHYVFALSSFQHAMDIDASPAKLHFEMGKCYFALKDSVKAKKAFHRARDLDALRFRATTEFNHIIKQTCLTNKTPLVDVEETFATHSKMGIIGNEFITEHLHPNFDGYFLMAKTIASAIVEYNFFNDNPRNLQYSDDYFKKISSVTLLDKALGDVKIQKLTSEWPYKNTVKIITYPDPNLKSVVEKIVHDYNSGEISWNEAHYRLAQYYSERNIFEKAIGEYLAVVKVVPHNYFPYVKIGNKYFIQDKLDLAEEWFQRALKLENLPFIHAKMGMVRIKKNEFRVAANDFETAIKIDNQHSQLSNEEKVLARYYLALCFIKLDKTSQAQSQIKHVLELDRNHKEAKQLLRLLNTQKKVNIQF